MIIQHDSKWWWCQSSLSFFVLFINLLWWFSVKVVYMSQSSNKDVSLLSFSGTFFTTAAAVPWYYGTLLLQSVGALYHVSRVVAHLCQHRVSGKWWLFWSYQHLIMTQLYRNEWLKTFFSGKLQSNSVNDAEVIDLWVDIYAPKVSWFTLLQCFQRSSWVTVIELVFIFLANYAYCYPCWGTILAGIKQKEEEEIQNVRQAAS
jgi:hypothetical protein